MDAGSIRARIELNTAQWDASYRRIRGDMQQMGRSSQQTSRDLGRIQTASAALGTAVAATFTTSINSAMNFESAIARLGAVSNAQGKDLESLKNAALEWGAKTQYSATQTAEALTFLAMAGFNVKDQIAALPAVLNAASAGQMDLARASDIVSNIMTGFGISAQDTENAVDVLVKTMTTANTDLPQLGEALKYVAPVAKSLGISFEDTATAIAKMSDAGIQGSNAGTALRAGLLSLANPTGQTIDAMTELGIKVTDANGSMKPLPELIGHIADKLGGMTDAQKTATLAQLVGVESASGFAAMLDVGQEKLAAYSKELKNSGGTAQRVAEVQMDTLKGAIEEFSGALETAGIRLGESFVPALTEVTKKAAEVVGSFDSVDLANAKSALAFGGTTAAVGLLLSTIGKLGIAFRTLSASPLGLAITGISILGGMLAATKVQAENMKTVTLENAQAMTKQADALSVNITEFDGLKAKSKLSNDELARFVDINSEISKTADPNIIAALKDEQDRLREKSGLSNDELNRMIDLNGQILDVVPDSSAVLTDQGNVLLGNTNAAKKYNAEQYELIRLELEAQAAKAEANMSQYLTDENRLLEEQRLLKEGVLQADKKAGDQREKIGELEKDLAKAIADGKDSMAKKIEFNIALEKKKLQDLKDQTKEKTQQIAKHEEEIQKIQAQIGKLDEVKRQMVDLELKQVGINGKRGEEIKQIDSAISKLETQKMKLQNNTTTAERNTEEYRRAVGEIDSQISGLNTAKSRINEIIGRAGVMNSELGRSINKTVTINERRYGNIVRGKGGFVPEYHTGGVVGKGPMPKLHTGGLASQFANMPNHNEIDVRLLQNEMVLTEAQQANLMRMIDAGFTRPGGDATTFTDPALIAAIKELASRPVTVNVDGYTIAEAAYPHIDNKMAKNMYSEMYMRGIK